MSLWKVKFNHKDGENRVCKLCGKTFHTMKPRYRCNACVNDKQKIIEAKKRNQYKKKAQYPFNNKTTEASNRFCRIRTQMSKAWKEFEKTGDKSIVIAHYDKQIKEINDNGIMEWILDRRDVTSKQASKPKTTNMTRKDYPDTRGHYE
jgi:hypothetical protein